MTTTAADTSLVVRPLNGHIGAEIVDADLDRLLDDEDRRARLRAALVDRAVVVMRRLAPDHEQHKALARIFGEIELPEAYINTVEGHPEICDFDSDGGYKADKWHADVMWRPTIPLGAVLCMRQLPESGGDTIWAHTGAAYDALSAPMKRFLDGLTAHHSLGPDMAADHPVVVTHPENGRKSLFVSELWTRHINDLTPEENGAVLGHLLRHLSRPEFCYRHRWSEGDVVIWDNRITQHIAISDYESRRVVQRVGITGSAPVA